MKLKISKDSFYGTGRRKRAMARVWLIRSTEGNTVNGDDLGAYLKRKNLQVLVENPLKSTKLEGQFSIQAVVKGGGIAGQAGALQLGVARALLQYDESLRASLRAGGFLTRDPREKERKKFGRKGARRSFQFTKR